MKSLYTRFIAAAMILCLIPSGCGTLRHATPVRDSVAVRIVDSLVLRDSIVYVPLPSETSTALISSSDTSHLETSIAVSDAWMTDGILHHSLSNKSAPLPVVVRVPAHYRAESTSSNSVLTRTIEVERHLTAAQSFFITIGKLCLVLIVLAIAFISIKKYVLKK